MHCLRFAVTSIIAAMAMVPPVFAAGNFEFAVPGEAGLTLKISGYGPDGAKMFDAQSNQLEMQDGKGLYVVRIDETILQATPLARWCVEDSSGKWSALQGQSTTTVCDDQPSETRGRYLFTPRLALAASPPDASAGPAAGSDMSLADASSCVQSSLNTLGYGAGTVDGQMGKRTHEAALQYAAVQDGEAYPELSDSSAALWCARMTAAIADGSARGPSDDIAKFRFGPDIDVATARDTQRGVAEIDAYFREAFGSALKDPGTIYVSSDAVWLTDSYMAHLNARQGIRAGKLQNFKGCHGGEAGLGFLFMCAKSDVFSGDWFGAGAAGQRTFALAHEYFHMVQYERALGHTTPTYDGRNTLNLLGPQWLVEGAAEYIAFRVLGDSNRMNFEREIEWHTGKAASIEASLVTLQTREGYYAEPLASSAGMIASHLLAETAGLASLANFYSEMPKGKGWEAAFEAAFGMTYEDFLAAYEQHIR